MAQEIVQYFGAHPGLLAALGAVALLAVIGLWYVVAHHLKEIVFAAMCFAGLASGVIVFYRGATVATPMRDLIGVGLFLIVLFPAIFLQAIRRSKVAQKGKPPATPGPVAPPRAA